MNVRLTQIDGKLPNIALMKLAHWHRSNGDEVHFERSVVRGMFEPQYGRVYGSAIFSDSAKKIAVFRANFPGAVVGGTGSGSGDTVETLTGLAEYENYDYSIYPGYDASIGFSQRGCRLRCKFCVVPEKEGKNRGLNTIEALWRQNPINAKKKILLLDNDFFGQPHWRDRAVEIIDGGYRVCFSQGINIRLIDREGAESLSRMKFMDDGFKRRRIYTAWDNARDEGIFMKGIGSLLDTGILPREIMVYFLCNWWEKGLTPDVWHRFGAMRKMGLLPYPMVYDKPNASQELKDFQTWVIRGAYHATPFDTFRSETKDAYFKKKARPRATLFTAHEQ